MISLGDQLEVVGFNGAPIVECGRMLPVVRRESDGMHCVYRLPAQDEPPLSWYSEEEAASFADCKRWTRFSRPLSIPRGCLQADGQPAQQPMVVFVDATLLDVADVVGYPQLASGEYLIWRKLQGYPETLQATCATADAVEVLLNDWASALINRFDAMFRAGREADDLKRIADFALCAAVERTLRWRSYLRYATAQNPDLVRRTFDRFTHAEFSDVPWDDFIRGLQALKDVLIAAPAIRSTPPGPVSSPPSTARGKLQNIAKIPPSDVGVLCPQ